MSIKEIEEYLKNTIKAYCTQDQLVIDNLRRMALNLLTIIKSSDIYKED